MERKNDWKFRAGAEIAKLDYQVRDMLRYSTGDEFFGADIKAYFAIQNTLKVTMFIYPTANSPAVVVDISGWTWDYKATGLVHALDILTGGSITLYVEVPFTTHLSRTKKLELRRE